MKVQWQLIDIETKNVIVKIGEPFDFSEEKIAEAWEKAAKNRQIMYSC